MCAVDKKENLSKKEERKKKIEYSLNTSEDIYLVKRLFKDKRSKEKKEPKKKKLNYITVLLLLLLHPKKNK